MRRKTYFLILFIAGSFIFSELCIAADFSRKIIDGEGKKDTDIFYAATKDSLHRTEDGGKTWEDVTLPPGVSDIKDITLTKNAVFIAASSGVYSKNGKGEWERKLGKEVIRTASYGDCDEREPYAEENEKETQEETDNTFLKSQTIKNGENQIWIGSGNRLNKVKVNNRAEKENGNRIILTNEIPVQEVHKMAIEYAEVSPCKIKQWREGARWKAFFPKLSLNFSESTDDNIEIYKNATTSYVVEGPREIDNSWGVGLSWDFSDIVWNDAQTSIDIRSKLMVQLREEILEEITRLYFERKKVLTEIDMLKEKWASSPEIYSNEVSDKLLKAEELTAYIDALTGGQFTKIINKKSKS